MPHVDLPADLNFVDDDGQWALSLPRRREDLGQDSYAGAMKSGWY